MKTIKHLAVVILILNTAFALDSTAADWARFPGKEGPGKGKHIVLITGDEEYRSEEAGPMLAKILSERHGFDCTVLFPLNPADGTIDPLNQTNIVGLKTLEDADMMAIFTRFRELPDSEMKYIAEFVNSGKPILGIRTATHAFDIKRNKNSAFAKYSWNSTKEWTGGFGQQVLGDTWVDHHGRHGSQSTRGIINQQLKDHPILKGVRDIWGPTDVYAITHLPADANVLVWGQVLEGMKRDDEPLSGPKNNPMMPLVWIRQYKGETGNTSRVICSTIGAAVDFESEGLRRLFVNACYWGTGLEDRIPAESNVDYVGGYKPSYFGFGTFVKGVKPADVELSN